MNDRVVKNPNFKNNGEFHRSLMSRGAGSKDYPNTHTEVEYLGNGKFAASIGVGHRVFFDKADGNKPKKYKLTDERPSKDYVLIQGAKCCVEVYPYYAKYFDVQHEEVRLYEERWVVQRWREPPGQWQDIGAWNPQIAVEEYPEPAGDVVKVTVTYDTDYGTLIVEYFQRDGNNLKHNVTFKNISGATETFRVLQRWAGIVGAKCNDKDIPIAEDTPFLAFHQANKSRREFTIAENLQSIGDYLYLPIAIETHAQGMKADFVYGNWALAQDKSLTIDPDTATLDDPTIDAYITHNANAGTYDRIDAVEILFEYHNTGEPMFYDIYSRGYAEWDISGIAAGSTVTKVEFRYEGTVNPGTDNCYIYAMASQPSVQDDDDAGNQVIFDDAGDGVAYLNNDAVFPEVGANKDVGGATGPAWDTDPKADLQTALGVGWFAFGFKTSETTDGDEARFNSEDKTDAANPKPTLYVEYNPPVGLENKSAGMAAKMIAGKLI